MASPQNQAMKCTLEECQQKALSRGGRCLSVEYKNNRTLMLWECSKGHQWEARFGHIKRDHWCPKCAKAAPINLGECQQLAISRGGKCLSTEYKNTATKMLWECSKGHQWEAVFGNIKYLNQWCPFCAGTAPCSLIECQRLAISRGGRCLSTEYKGARTKMLWECKCSYRWYATYNNIKTRESWCPKCARRAPLTLEECQKLAISRGGKCLSTEYKSNAVKMLWECSEGHQWEAKFGDIKYLESWCPKCVAYLRSSEAEQQLFEFVKGLFPDAKNNRKGLLPSKGLELDIYIPSLKKAIEYDGEFWHYSEWAVKHGSKERDSRKTQQCQEVGIELLRILDKKYKQNPQHVKECIISFLGLN